MSETIFQFHLMTLCYLSDNTYDEPVIGEVYALPAKKFWRRIWIFNLSSEQVRRDIYSGMLGCTRSINLQLQSTVLEEEEEERDEIKAR